MSTTFSLEDAMRSLEEIERYFQQPSMNLEEAIAKHKEALGIAKEIIAYLKTAETSLEKLSVKELLADPEADGPEA